MIEESSAHPEVIKEKILEGHIFTLVNKEDNKFVIYKTKKFEDHTVVWSKIVGKKYTRLCIIKYHALSPILFTNEDKAKKRIGIAMLTIFWGNLTAGIGTEGITIWHATRCRRCNRPLTDPWSITLGIGPTCAEKERQGIPYRGTKRNR